MRAYLQLVRLPAVFTAVADTLMAWFVTHTPDDPGAPVVLALLLAATVLQYMAGMALNDVFDRQIDAAERPQRPIPSGRVSLSAARGLGFAMLVAGLGAGWAVTVVTGNALVGGLATALALAVVGYDAGIKRTPLGPLGMGACRFLNLLMVMSVAGWPFDPAAWAIAGSMATYIVGVTIFARFEAEQSRSAWLLAGMVVMAAGLVSLALTPRWVNIAPPPPDQFLYPIIQWRWVMAGLGAVIGFRCLMAVLDPIPQHVQQAVRNSLLALIVLDAVLVLGMRSVAEAMYVIVLIVPAVGLGRWLHAT